MPRALVTGLGFVCSLGNDAPTVAAALAAQRHGLEAYPPFAAPEIPVKVVGTIKGFDTSSPEPDDWTYPERRRFRRDVLRSMSPHVLYAFFAVAEALEDAGLGPDEVSDPGTGLYTASGGSMALIHHNLTRIERLGPTRGHPLAIVSAAVGTLNFNLVAHHRIRGSSCGFASACASSAHALGFAWEEIVSGRQQRMIVVGAEDCDAASILPFVAMRTLSSESDPARASRPFDRRRDGFVPSGGACALILEAEDAVRRRGRPAYAELAGWGQASDGFNVAISHPEGDGVRRAMLAALARAGVGPSEVDYINAHATSTVVGDAAEARAIAAVFGLEAPRPAVSSTKALTGHGISVAGALEAGLCCLTLRDGYIPGNPHLEEIDPACAGIDAPRAHRPVAPRVVLSNNSGFGGANVALVLRRP